MVSLVIGASVWGSVPSLGATDAPATSDGGGLQLLGLPEGGQPADPRTWSVGGRFSWNGRYLAYGVGEQSLSAPVNPAAVVRDLATGTSRVVEGLSLDVADWVSGISDDGQTLLFGSKAALVPEDTNGAVDVYRHDFQTGTNVLVSIATTGGAGNGGSTLSRMSADGRFVVFASTATDLVVGDPGAGTDVFLRDTLTKVTIRLAGQRPGTATRLPSAVTEARCCSCRPIRR